MIKDDTRFNCFVDDDDNDDSSTSRFWYSQDDYDSFREDIIRTVKLSRLKDKNKNNIDHQKENLFQICCLCTRGIEHMICKRRSKVRKQRIQSAWDIVCNHRHQATSTSSSINNNTCDDDTSDSSSLSSIIDQEAINIVETYTELSTQCRLEARLRGIRDRVEAKKCFCYEETFSSDDDFMKGGDGNHQYHYHQQKLKIDKEDKSTTTATIITRSSSGNSKFKFAATMTRFLRKGGVT